MPKRRSPLQRAAAWLPAVVWAGLIYLASSQPSLPSFDLPGQLVSIAGHFFVYAVLMVLLIMALRRSTSLTLRWVWLVAFLLAALYGISDEYHQSFVPGRDPSVLDWLTDLAGAGTVWWVLRSRARRVAHEADADPQA